MNKKVLVAYGSNYGCTKEIAEYMNDYLKEHSINSMLINLKQTKSALWPSLNEFDGVLIGSGIKINKWIKQADRFLRKYAHDFKTKGIALGMFVCSAYAVSDRSYAEKTYLEDVMEKHGFDADVYAAFPGVFDFSKSSHMGFFDKKMLKLAAKGMAEEMELSFDENGLNDFRNWKEIEEFVQQFSYLLNNEGTFVK